MECRLRLRLQHRENRENRERRPGGLKDTGSIDAAGDIPLYPGSPASRREVTDRVSLIAEGIYTCTAFFTEVDRPIRGIELFLNEESIGYGGPLSYLSRGEQMGDILFRKEFLNEGMIGDLEDRKEGRPFLLHYDLVQFALKVQDDGYFRVYTSDYVLCLSKHGANAENIEDIIAYLAEFNDDTINTWMFSPQSGLDRERLLSESMEQTRQRKASFKSLSAYIQLLTSIYTCYKENYPAFKSGAKHRMVKHDSLQSYDQVKSISRRSLQWLYQNPGELAATEIPTAIHIQGRHYLPYRMHIEKTTKSFDIYENRVVVGFLLLVCNNVKGVAEKVRIQLAEEYQVLHKLQWLEREGFRAPIIGIKQFQAERNQVLFNKLHELLVNVAGQYAKYRDILPCSGTPLLGIPKKTKVFQEVRPYRQVFEQILRWYHFGDFIPVKESLIGNAKTLDKLFEYYCLCRLLTLLKEAGFTGTGEVSRSFIYHSQEHRNQELANTYLLRRGELLLTLYYQPVISADRFENDISLYRTTTTDGFYTPDFMVKLHRDRTSRSCYLIFDAKYSSRWSIKQHYMDREIIKYGCQLSDREAGQSVKMVWLLQGRIDDTAPIERYHSSPLAQQYKPAVSYGIIKVHTRTDTLEYLWKEIYPFMQELERPPV
ncbi:MAG: restriction endonuclease-like protein [Treponema sp.]|jgi:predicted component of viral defense system (DUF524 family)|nr:restriction endonuclease-like protein [Treponema sp.]